MQALISTDRWEEDNKQSTLKFVMMISKLFKYIITYMFILILHYNAPIEEINKYMEAHKAYLNKHYASGRFIASGRQNPPTSDIILCRASDIREAEHIISQDPFVLVGDYQIIAFTPNRIAHGFEQWLSTMN